jgi:hypothetical protein
MLCCCLAPFRPELGISLPDYVNSRLRVIIDGDMPAVLEALNMDTRQK